MTTTMKRTKDPIKALLPVASRDKGKPAITGVYIGDGVAVATNGALLVRVPYDGELATGIHGNEKLRVTTGDPWPYPNYNQVIPKDCKHTKPITATTLEAIQEVIAINKANGLEPGRKVFPQYRRDPGFISVRFEVAGEFHHYDPFRLTVAIQALRKAGHTAISLGFNGPLDPVSVLTPNPIAIAVLMPLRPTDKYITVN